MRVVQRLVGAVGAAAVLGALTAVSALTALVLLVPGAAPAGAQECVPGVYGCPTTTTGGEGEATTIVLSVDEGVAGTTLTAEACGFAEGSTVGFTFGGQEVGSGVPGGDGCTTATIVVPGIGPGGYDVCAVAAGRPSACADFTVLGEGGVGVLGVQQEAPSAAVGGTGAGGSGPSGALARTGLAVGGLVLAAVLLVVGGRAVGVVAGDRGRRRVAR